jgi:succinate dehydrogenase / fumarate reductase flavoprotein subunit
MSESARGEGGRVWVPGIKRDDGTWGPHPRSGADPKTIPTNERYYFLEERYPAYGNIVPRDIATREIFDICVNSGMGVNNENQVYLDLTHRDPEYLAKKLGGILDIYEKFVGDDPKFTPMKIFPAVHYSMGGLWTQFSKGSYNPREPRDKHKSGSRAPLNAEIGQGMEYGSPINSMTNVKGLYAFGEVNFAYHGANRLGANALLSCLFDGLCCGVSVVNYVRNDDIASKQPAEMLTSSAYEAVVEQEQAKVKALTDTVGRGEVGPATNPYIIHKELGNEMTAACTVVKSAARLEQCRNKIAELRERFSRVRLGDAAAWTNQTLSYTRAVGDMLLVSEAICLGSIERKESRGAHYRTDYPTRDDSNYMKSTVAKFVKPTKSTQIELVEIDASLIRPTARTYGKKDPAGAGAASAKKVASPEGI